LSPKPNSPTRSAPKLSFPQLHTCLENSRNPSNYAKKNGIEFDHVPKILRLIFLSIIFPNPETGKKWPTPNPPPFPAAPTEKAEALISAIQLDSTSSNPIAAEDGAAVCVALAPPGVRRVLWQSKNGGGAGGGVVDDVGRGTCVCVCWEGVNPPRMQSGRGIREPPTTFHKLLDDAIGMP